MRTRGTAMQVWWRAALAIPGLAVAASAWGTVAVAHEPGRTTTYAGSSDVAAALTIAAGVALGIAGLAVALGGVPRIGVPTLLAALAWFAPVYVGWRQGPLVARSLAMVVAGFVVPLLVQVVLTHPTGRPPNPAARLVLLATYAEATMVAVVTALFRDPFDDPYAWANDTGNSFAVTSLPDLARATVVADQWFSVGLAAVVAGVCGWGVAAASVPARRTLLPVALAGVVLMSALAVRAVLLLRSPLEDPTDGGFRVAFVLACSACVLLGAALTWGLARRRLQHRAVSRIAANLGEAPAPGSLASALGRAVGDPGLRIAYWLPDDSRYVDASGSAVAAPTAAPGRSITTLVRDDQTVAVVSHAGGAPEIESAMGAAFTLALDNERLQAEAQARLEELRASRARIVETGDLERRTLERDLHDGAQQRLIAVAYEIGLAQSEATAAADLRTATELRSALAGTLAALEELRGLAHGLFPAILGEAGLAAALASLADTAPVVLDTGQVASARYAAAVELAAYLMVTEAVDDAVDRHATRVSVRADEDGGVLAVVIEDDGHLPLADLVRSGDRIGALGGTLEVGAQTRRAEIPCV